MYDPTLANLEGLAPDVRQAAIYLVNAYRSAGYPAIIVSGRRTSQRNQQVGGVPDSRHLSGRAIDLGFSGVASPPVAWFAAGAALWKSWGGRWGGDFVKSDPVHFDGG